MATKSVYYRHRLPILEKVYQAMALMGGLPMGETEDGRVCLNIRDGGKLKRVCLVQIFMHCLFIGLTCITHVAGIYT